MNTFIEVAEDFELETKPASSVEVSCFSSKDLSKFIFALEIDSQAQVLFNHRDTSSGMFLYKQLVMTHTQNAMGELVYIIVGDKDINERVKEFLSSRSGANSEDGRKSKDSNQGAS